MKGNWNKKLKVSSPYIVSLLATYVFFVIDTGHFNPAKLKEIYRERNEQRQKRQKEQSEMKQREQEYRERYEGLYNQLLNLSDRDKNGYVDFAEQVSAWRRMGYFERPFIESKGIKFPEPTLENLEKAVKSYQKE